MSITYRLLQLALVVLSLAIGMQAEDREDREDGEGRANCSNATLHGSYGLHATGKDFAAVARFVFDGNGGLTGKLFGRVPGTNIGPLEFTGTYSVNPDCTVTDNWLDSTHVSVIVDKGKGYFILNVTEGPDGVNSGEARRQ
jgi:hypothetical protein